VIATVTEVPKFRSVGEQPVTAVGTVVQFAGDAEFVVVFPIESVSVILVVSAVPQEEGVVIVADPTAAMQVARSALVLPVLTATQRAPW
jgi:hypothetical protein